MISKLSALLAYLIAGISIFAAYTQVSALRLRQEEQPLYSPRHNTALSGDYRDGRFHTRPNRSAYGNFRGGGQSVGK